MSTAQAAPAIHIDEEGRYLLKASTQDDDGKMHVELADSMDYAESWGTYLADIARTIARDHDFLETNREDRDLLAALVDGFIKGLREGYSFSSDLAGITLAEQK